MFGAGGDAEFGAAGPWVRSDLVLGSGQGPAVHRRKRREHVAAEVALLRVLEVAGPQEVLHKPVHPDTMIEAMRRALQSK